MSTHWAIDYIGDPWVAGEHDCWAFARRVWREQFGLDIPAVDVDSMNRMACVRAFAQHDERCAWAKVDVPEEGDAVLMGKNTRPSHVGVWVDAGGGGVLHCVEVSGVLYNTVQSLGFSGFRVLGYYRRAT